MRGHDRRVFTLVPVQIMMASFVTYFSSQDVLDTMVVLLHEAKAFSNIMIMNLSLHVARRLFVDAAVWPARAW